MERDLESLLDQAKLKKTMERNPKNTGQGDWEFMKEVRLWLKDSFLERLESEIEC